MDWGRQLQSPKKFEIKNVFKLIKNITLIEYTIYICTSLLGASWDRIFPENGHRYLQLQ